MGARNQVGIGLSYRAASQCSWATQFQTRFLESIPRPIVFDSAFHCHIFILLSYIFTLVVVLSTLVVESVRDLVSDDPANAAVVHVGRSVRLEKITLEKTKNDCVLEIVVFLIS
jgi:hypothetical protein